MIRHVQGKLWSQTGVRTYAVRNVNCALYRTVYCARIRENPEAIYDCVQRSKAHLVRRKDYLLDEPPLGAIWQNNERDRRRTGSASSSTTFVRDALAEVAKEKASCRSRQHPEVNVLYRQDSRVCGLSTDVAFVRQMSTDGVGGGSRPFAEVVRRPAETFGGLAPDRFASVQEPTGEDVRGPKRFIFRGP
jgi:hypothetical protein